MSHRYTPIIVALTAHGGACRTPTYGRNATEHGVNTNRYTTDIRLTTRTPPPLAAFATDGHARAARPNADSATDIQAARFPIGRLGITIWDAAGHRRPASRLRKWPAGQQSGSNSVNDAMKFCP